MSFPPVPGADSFINGLKLRAATPAAGYTLVNGTGGVVSWTAPADGNNHRFLVIASLDVTSAETGGAAGVNFTTPDGTSSPFQQLFAGGQAADAYGAMLSAVIESGSTVYINQTSALTAGAAKLWAEIWGS